MSDFRVHRVRFFQYTPQAIQVIAFDDSEKKLAVGRADNSIEIWNCKENIFHHEKTIHGDSGRSVESLAWLRGRLFSAGLHGDLTEYDLSRLRPKTTSLASGGAIWCMQLNCAKDCLAIGTDDGTVSLYEILGEGVQYSHSFDRQEGRVMCLAWRPSGEHIVTGSTDALRIWSVKLGRVTQRLTLGRATKQQETLVWTVAVTRDFTIVAGDSTGKVSFFNGIHGNLLQVFQANKADVLTLCLNEEENKLFCGGVEPGISQFEKVIAGPGNDSFHRDYQKWVPSLPRLLHTHDVKSLCMAGEFLVSGGVDTNLGLSKYPPKTYITLPHIPKNSVHLAEKAACLMLQYADYLEVWKLGDTAVELEMGVEGGDGEMLPLTKGAKKLLQLKTRNDERVICSAISRDARWLAYSHTSAIHLYQLSLDEEKPLSVHRVKYLPPGVQPAHHLCFAGSDRLLVATETGDVQVLEVDSVKPKLLHNFDGCQEAVSHIRASNCGRYAAVGNFSRTVIVYDIIEFKKVCAMPQFPQQVAALCFHPRDLELLVVYADNSVVEYSIAEKGYTSWSRRYAKMRHQMEPAEHVGTTLNVMYHPSDEKHSQLILHGDKRVRCIDKTEVQSRKRGGALHVCDRIHYLVHVAPSAPDWLVIVERTPQSIAVTLPPTLAVKKFGT